MMCHHEWTYFGRVSKGCVLFTAECRACGDVRVGPAEIDDQIAVGEWRRPVQFRGELSSPDYKRPNRVHLVRSVLSEKEWEPACSRSSMPVLHSGMPEPDSGDRCRKCVRSRL